MARILGIFILFVGILVRCHGQQQYPIPRGAQVRLTNSGLEYGASIGVRKIESELTNKRINTQSGSKGDVSYTASNILVNHLRVGSHSFRPLAGDGITLSMSGISLEASAKISVKYRKGWIKISDSKNVKITGKNIGFTLNVKIDASNGKPHLQGSSCSAHIGDIDLDFSGGAMSWVYNMISSIFEDKLKDILRGIICEEGIKVINTEANNFLKGFPVQQNIENYAIINYAFQSPVVTKNYIDFLLRGEFLDPKHPTPSPKQPPIFDTITSSNKMAYVWITDFTLNSAGDVFHKTGLLKKLIGPLTDKIPPEVKPFLNTKSFEKFIPMLYQKFPDRPIEFQLQTNQAPTFEISPGKVNVKIDVRANVVVDKIDGSKLSVFYIDLVVDANGSVFVKSINNQLNVGGNIAGFTFNAAVGGSVIGEISLPLDDPSIKMLVQGLVIENANTVLNKGFPIPRVDHLSFINPQVTFVQHAIRIDTDISYTG